MRKGRKIKVLSVVLAIAMIFTVGVNSGAYALSEDGSQELMIEDSSCNKYKTGVDWDKLVPGEDYVPGEIVVTFVDDLSSEDTIYEIASEHGFEVLEVLGFYDWKGGKLARFSLHDDMAVTDAIKEIECETVVQCATPNGIFHLYSSVNDMYYDDQWYIGNIGINDAWDIAKCNNEVTVAVLDTGIDLNHPDLAGNILTYYAWDVITGSSLLGDYNYHGTQVAGVIAAVANNSTGIAGVSYNANIIPVRVFESEEEEESSSTMTNIWKGFKYVVEDIDCESLKVINLSGGVTVPYFSIETIINEAASKGIITVCAAGNFENDSPTYPACYEECIAVIATDVSDGLCDFSTYGSWCDISAPGYMIWSTTPSQYGFYYLGSGTSFAAPIISGVIALMFAANPDLTNNQVKYILYDTAVDLGDPGRDNYFGWGRVDAYAAVLRACEGYWERISGTNRYFTMRNLSQKGWDDNSCDTVVVATGEAFPDALAGTALAGVYDCPIILTLSDTLSPQSALEIQRLGAENVIIVGGTGAVSDSVKTSIEGIVGAGHVTRLSGSNRFATAYSIYNSCVNEWSDTLIVATGMSAADVLSIAPYAYASKSPIFLVDQNGNLSPNMQASIQAGNFDKAVIIGSSYIVSTQTETLLTTELGNSNVHRISGSDRYITSSMVADWEAGENITATVQPSVLLDYTNVSVVNGAEGNFPDALSGSPFCGHIGSVMLLTSGSMANNNYTIQNNIIPHTDDIEIGYVIGGTGVLSELFEHYLENLCQ